MPSDSQSTGKEFQYKFCGLDLADAPEQARHRFCLWETKGGPWYGKLKESRLHTQGVLPEYLSNRNFQNAMDQTEQLGWRILQTLTWNIPPAGRPATRYWEDQHRSTRLYLDNNLPGAVAAELAAERCAAAHGHLNAGACSSFILQRRAVDT